MTSRQLGHRAAAQGAPREAPVDGSPTEWFAGYDAAEEHRKNTRDPAGHPPHLPHLCARDVSKVCSCCDTCKRICWSEGVVIKATALLTRLQKAVRG